METKAQRTRRGLLDAAERLVDQHGAARLTLAGVAKEAGVSKGGLLYHFGTKDELIAAMLDRRFARFDDNRASKVASDANPTGREARAYLLATAEEKDPEAAAGLLAAVANNLDLLRPLQERYAVWQQALSEDEGLSAEQATVVRLIADGLWLSELMGFAPPDDDLRERIITLAAGMTEGSVSKG
ncbi:MAG: AcrR family transcriptional regulator [Myxococcota bacterium]|jgi:AcrR family transcriptional regulator